MRHRSIGVLIVFFLGIPALAALPPLPEPSGRLTLAAVERASDWLDQAGTEVNEILEAILRTPESPIRQYLWSRAQLARRAVAEGKLAGEALKRFADEAGAQGNGPLEARLLLDLGRGEMSLGHHASGLETIAAAAALYRRLGDGHGLCAALGDLAHSLLHKSRRPWDALSPINELLVTANRLGDSGATKVAVGLYEEWRTQAGQAEDYFGRARSRLAQFGGSLGFPDHTGIIGQSGSALYVAFDTDDQFSVSPDRRDILRFDGLFVRSLTLEGAESLKLRGAVIGRGPTLWVATNQGVFRYDARGFSQWVNAELEDEDGNDLRRALAAGQAPAGTERKAERQIERHSSRLSSNIVNDIAEGQDGRLYLATAAGLDVLDPASGHLEHLGAGADSGLPLPVERVRVGPDGTLIVTSGDNYALRPAGQNRFKLSPFGPARAQAQSPNQLRESSQPATILGGSSMEGQGERQHLFGLVSDRGGGFWVHGIGGARRIQSTGATEDVGQQTTGARTVTHVLRTADGALWFGTARGLCRLSGSYCAPLNSSRWLASDFLWDLWEWPALTIWASAMDGGLYRLAPPNARHYSTEDGFDQPIARNMESLNGVIFLIHGYGLTRFDPRTGQVDNFVSAAEGLPTGRSTSGIVQRLTNGQLALAFQSAEKREAALVLFDGQRGRSIGQKEGIPDAPIVSLCEAASGLLLVFQADSVLEWDMVQNRARRADVDEGVIGERIRQAVCSVGEPVFILTEAGRLYDLSARPALLDLAGMGLRGKPLRLLRRAHTGLVVVGEGNLARLEAGRWTTLDFPPGMDPQEISAVEVDLQGKLYFAASTGVFVWNGEIWTRLGEKDGLTTDAAYEVLYQDGRLWIAGNAGIASWWWPEGVPPETFLLAHGRASYTDPAAKPRTLLLSDGIEQADRILLRGLSGTFALPADQAGSFLDDLAPPAPAEACDSVPYEDAQVVLGYTGGVPFEDDAPADLRYHVRLDSGSWRPVGPGPLVLEDLADGPHQVELRATDRRLRVDETPARYCFEVKTPRSAWSLAAAALLGGLLLFFARRPIYWWLRRLRHRRFRPIEPNPFFYNRPAEGSAIIGREHLLERLLGLVRQSGGVVAVFGERGVGKFSLVRELERRLEPPRELSLAIDLATSAAGGDIGHVVQSVLSELERLLRENEDRLCIERSSGSNPASSSSITDEVFLDSQDSSSGISGRHSLLNSSSEVNQFEQLSRVLDRLGRLLPTTRVVLFLDSAEVLSLAMDHDTSYGSFFFPFLRSLAQKRPRVTVVLDIEGRTASLGQRFGQLLGFASAIPLGRLDDAQVERALSEPLQGRALLEERARAALVELTGGLPALVQAVGSRLVEELNASLSNVGTPALTERIAEALVLSERSLLEMGWTDLSREEKLTVMVLAETHPARLTAEAVFEKLEAAGGSLLLEESRRALTGLAREGILQVGPGGFSLRGELFRRHLLSQRTLAGVLEESRDSVAHYQILERLGEGGMGVVYKARDLISGAIVALKLLQPNLSEHKRSRRRFLREAKLGKRLRHPNIVSILDYGEHGGRLYLAMEYLDGKTLQTWRHARGSISPAEVAQAGIHLASALCAIHKLGIIHRDVKSENVMVVGPDGPLQEQALKLMDFGLAAEADLSRLTREGTLIGTVAYMSPEQAKGEATDPLSDLYSLGVLLYELLTGSLPFAGTEAAILRAVVEEPTPKVASRLPSAPAPLAALIDQLLSKSPSERPTGANEVRERLEAMDLSTQATPLPEASAGSSIVSRSLEALRNRSRMLSSVSSNENSDESQEDLGRTLIYRVSAAVAKGQIDLALQRSCLQTTCQALGADTGRLFHKAPGGAITCAVEVGLEADAPLEPKLRELVERCITGQVGFLADNRAEAEAGSLLLAPLWAGQEVLGVLALERREPEAQRFDDDDLDLLACVGYLLGLGLQRERLFHKVLAQERMVAAAQMMGSLAHDLRNPMTVISVYAHVMDSGPVDEPLRLEISEALLQQVADMSAMIENLLSFVRGEVDLKTSQVSIDRLGDALVKVFSKLASAKGVSLRVQSDGGEVCLDESRVKRILQNLCKNAIEATPTGEQVHVLLREEEGALEIEVRDRGTGIPPEVQSRLFEPFVTAGKRRGTGLGLAIVKRFVDDHGGRIAVDTAPERGTTFAIRLPGQQSA